jgi:hypothetical protein
MLAAFTLLRPSTIDVSDATRDGDDDENHIHIVPD